MRSEADFTNYIQNRLTDVKIFSDTQSSHVVELDNALSTASKAHNGKRGYPDHIALVEDFVLVMEDKSDRLKLVLRDGGELSRTVDATQNYALNGALHYALKIIDGTRYKKVFAFGNAGDRKHHIIQPIFVDADRNITELPPVETFKNFTAENIDSYYRRMILKETPPEELELKKILRRAELLHEHLRNYGQLGEDEKPLVVSAILLALAEEKNFNTRQLTGDTIHTDGAKIFEHVENHLKRANVRPEVKKERVLSQFRLIKDRPLLNAVNRTLEMTPLKFFTEFIADKIYDAVVNNSAEDYLGRFYGEFISYSGGDGQSLGVVLTPRHIAELFCELVDLKPDDTVFDPCCGTGSFLIAAMSRMLRDADDHQRKLIKQRQIHGIEAREDMFSIATTNMILRGDGQSNLLCGDFFAHEADDLLLDIGATVGMMNPPYSQAKNAATAHLSELRFIRHLLNSVVKGGRVAVIVPVSAMIGKTRDDKRVKGDILQSHTLEGVISLNKNTFYRIGVVPCIAVFTAGEPHPKSKRVKFINFEDDGFEVKKHVGLIETERAKDRRSYLLDCWRGNITDAPSKFMVETTIEPEDEWLHSFYYYNDELPAAEDFSASVADYLTFEFNMIAHGREYLFGRKKKLPPLTEPPPLAAKTWREFFIGELVDISPGKRLTKADMIAGDTPFIGASDSNNGVTAFVGNENASADENILGVNYNGSVAENFYHPYRAVFSDDVKRFRLKNSVGNEFVYLFLKTTILQQRGKYTYGYKFNETRMRRQKILLPVTDGGAPDFDYMAAYVANIEEHILQRYCDYADKLSVSGGGITPLSDKPWREFFIGELFRLEAGKSKGLTHLEADESGISYLGATNRNNAVLSFVRPVEDLIQRGNCIAFIRNGEGSIGYSVYKREDFIATSDITCGYANFLNEFVGLFITTIADKVRGKYNFNYKRSDSRLKREKIRLPVTDDGAPDFEYMAAYARRQVAEILRRYEKFLSRSETDVL
ncbi:MAG: N-6 DNA methylase [Quinella sp. 2Q5]|nr:N-6 DNA methylase [Quinella sp. 2Q5]